MSQDIVSDALNKVMNAKRAGKKEVDVNIFSKVLTNILEIGKKEGYIKDYKIKEKKLKIQFDDNLNLCKTVKPRYHISVKTIEKYMKRYLPGRNIGVLVISTNQGLMTHQEAYEQKLGGALIAYFY